MLKAGTLLTMILVIAGSLGCALPSQAEYAIVGEQPAVGSLHTKEAELLSRLNHDYELGLIDPYELANLTRDLDSIRVKEEALRMRKQGMTPKASAKIEKALAAFEANLDERAAQNGPTTVAVSQAL